MQAITFTVFDTVSGKDVTNEKNFMLSPEGQLMVECDDIDCPMIEAEPDRYEIKVSVNLSNSIKTVAVYKS